MRTLRTARWGCQCVALWAVACLGGCGGGNDFGENVSVPQERVDRGHDVLSRGGVLVLPADRPFNTADAQRHSEGAAHAESKAESSGRASCTADASSGGRAGAEFQLGHVLAYDGEEPFRASVTFDVDYACLLTRDPPDAPQANWNQPLGLKAYIMDSDRRMLGRVMLAEADEGRLPDRWSGSQSPSFEVTLEPGSAYHLIVAGKVEVSGDDTQGPRAALEVTRAEIHISPASKSTSILPAPPG